MSRKKFDVASLLSSTPRSSNLRAQRAVTRLSKLRRFSPGSRWRFSGLQRLSPGVISKSRLRKRCTPSSSSRARARVSCSAEHNEQHPVIAHRCLEDQFDVVMPPDAVLDSEGTYMRASEAEVCQVPDQIIVIESFLGKISEDIGHKYPELKQQFLSFQDGTVHWLELRSPHIHVDPALGPCDVVRLLISVNKSYQIQVMLCILLFGLLPKVSTYKIFSIVI